MNNANKKTGYTSRWQDQLDDTMGKIMNREKFTYDLNGDALWNQYKDQYVTGGKMAMMDTMGQAAALTGGYGNSYAQGVGQQAYQGYLQGLNDKIPQLYQMALDSYDREGDALLQQYGMMTDRENTDYNRFIDDRNYQYQLDKDQADLDAQNQADQRAMALAMLEAGIRPSDEMLSASGLNMEYVNAMYPMDGAAGANGEIGIDMSTKWWEKTVNEGESGWLASGDGRKWQRSTQGSNWLRDVVVPDVSGILKGGAFTDEMASALKTMGLSKTSIDEVERMYNESTSG